MSWSDFWDILIDSKWATNDSQTSESRRREKKFLFLQLTWFVTLSVLFLHFVVSFDELNLLQRETLSFNAFLCCFHNWHISRKVRINILELLNMPRASNIYFSAKPENLSNLFSSRRAQKWIRELLFWMSIEQLAQDILNLMVSLWKFLLFS